MPQSTELYHFLTRIVKQAMFSASHSTFFEVKWLAENSSRIPPLSCQGTPLNPVLVLFQN